MAMSEMPPVTVMDKIQKPRETDLLPSPSDSVEDRPSPSLHGLLPWDAWVNVQSFLMYPALWDVSIVILA